MGFASQIKSLVNLTAHDVHLFRDGRLYFTFQPSGKVAHVETIVEGPGLFKKRTAIRVANLPDPIPGMRFIVSTIVAHYFPEREDLVCSACDVRGDNNVVLGTTSFVRDSILDTFKIRSPRVDQVTDKVFRSKIDDAVRRRFHGSGTAMQSIGEQLEKVNYA